MGKRRHKSSSVEEVSPAIIKRKSSRLTRSKKLKPSKVPSPGLRNSPVSRQLEAGPSRTRNLQGHVARSSKVHHLLDYNTPVRPKHGRTSHLHLNSPHSESEPEIIWDDKSPNAVQPRRLGKGGKRNAVEDISDIINCVPDITTDNSNKKPSLLSLWMTRDSPSPKPTNKTNQESKRPSKKKSVSLKTRKSRLSALTHELEKVLSAIEPEKEDEKTQDSEQPSRSIPTTVVSSTTTSVKTRRTSPTLYTQTKPPQVNQAATSILLPELGHSPPLIDENKKQDSTSPQKTQENPMGIEKDDESPPGSQTKWEAFGNESVNDLWGDDDIFEDDDLLTETIEVEIASSQGTQSTLKRKVKKRQSLKAAGTSIKKVILAKPVSIAQPSKPSVKAAMSTTVTTGLVKNNQQTKPVKSTDTKQPNTLVTACSTDTVPVQSQIKTVNNNSEKTLSSNYPVQVKLECCESRFNNKMPQSQKVFVPHTGNPKSSFQAYKPAPASFKKVDLQTTCVPMCQETQKNATKSTAYSLRSGQTMSTSTAELQVTNTMSKLPNSSQSTTVNVSHSSTRQLLTRQSVINSSTNRTLHQIMPSQTSSNKKQEDMNTSYKLACNSTIDSTSTVTLSVSTVSVDSTSRTQSNPPNVTRIVYNAPITSTVTNPLSFDLPISQSNNLVPFRSASQSKQALSQCTTRKSSAMNTKPADPPKTTSQNTGHVLANDSNKLISSNVYVPFQKLDPLKNQNITEKVTSHDTFQLGTNGNSSQLPNKFVPFSQQNCLATAPTSGNISQSKNTSKPCNSTKNTKPSKTYVPYKKTGIQILPSPTQTQSLRNVPSAGGVNNNSPRFESSTSEKPATQTQTTGSCNIPPETSPHSAASVIAPCSIPSKTEFVKPPKPITTDVLIKTDGNETLKTFVPFKKPQRQGMNQLKPINSTNSSKYKPAIISSQMAPKFQPVISSSKQYKQFSSSQTRHTPSQTHAPSNTVPVTKSNVFVSRNSTTSVARITNTSTDVHSAIRQTASVTSSKPNVCVKHTMSGNSLSTNEGKRADEKYLQTNQISTNSKHSNNNTKKIIPQTTGSAKMTNPYKSDGHSHSTAKPCASFSETSVLNSVGNKPVSQLPKEQIEQFDDSLPDEILMSLVDMDGSWDEF